MAKKKTKVLLVSSPGGWVALYLDGVKTIENHTLRPQEVLKALGVDFEDFELGEEGDERHGNGFPEDAADFDRKADFCA